MSAQRGMRCENLLYPFAVHLAHGLERLVVGGHEDKATSSQHGLLCVQYSPTATYAVKLREKNGVLNHAEGCEECLELDSVMSVVYSSNHSLSQVERKVEHVKVTRMAVAAVGETKERRVDRRKPEASGGHTRARQLGHEVPVGVGRRRSRERGSSDTRNGAWVSCAGREGANSHSVDSESVTKTEKAHDLGVGRNPYLSPLERALGRRVEEDTSDTHCCQQRGWREGILTTLPEELAKRFGGDWASV